jgi:hypothetical protein
MTEPTITAAVTSAEEAPVVTATLETPIEPVAPVIPPELTELVGEGKKYASVDVALASLPAKEDHIKNLEEQIASQAQMKELLEEFRTNQAKGVHQPEKVGIDQTQVSEIVRQELIASETKRIRQGNINSVYSQFTAKYGDKTDEVFNQIAKDNGTSPEGLLELTRTAPEIVLKLAGFSKQAEPVTSLRSSINTDALESQVTPEPDSARVGNVGNSSEVTQGWVNAGKKAKDKLRKQGLIT